MCETNTCVCRYFLFALKPYTGIYSFRQAKQNSKAKHLCSALKLYPNIFFYFIHTCTLFRKAVPLHIHYTLFRLFAQQQLTLPVLHNRIYANFSHQPFFPHLLSQCSPPLQPLTAFSLLRQTDLFQIPIHLQYPVKF